MHTAMHTVTHTVTPLWNDLAGSLAQVGPEPTVDALRQALRACHQALAESQAREEMALRMAAHDALTGLPNRRAFVQHYSSTLHRHAEQADAFCVLFIDLDGFKAVNDELGHAAGDALLQLVGQRLAHGMRRGDFVGRLGGDEFVCLLPHLRSVAQARVLTRKLIASITAPCSVGAQTVRIGASVGAALYPRDGRTMELLLEHADQAMRGDKARKRLPPPRAAVQPRHQPSGLRAGSAG
jgi:diguanylate cyclase (GGDEF)-like protein